jgi:hypothetical protein
MVKLQIIQRPKSSFPTHTGPGTVRNYDLVINDVVVVSMQEQRFLTELHRDHFDKEVASLVTLYEKALGVSAEIITHQEETRT